MSKLIINVHDVAYIPAFKRTTATRVTSFKLITNFEGTFNAFYQK